MSHCGISVRDVCNLCNVIVRSDLVCDLVRISRDLGSARGSVEFMLISRAMDSCMSSRRMNSHSRSSFFMPHEFSMIFVKSCMGAKPEVNWYVPRSSAELSA